MAVAFRSFLLENKVRCAVILLLFSYWIPILRFGFDPHHDGLIVGTVHNLELKSSTTPFNQYGPAWFLLLKFITSLLPHEYFFLITRLVTLAFYLFAIISTYYLAKHYLSVRQSLNVVILILGIQPFATDFNSDMIPWPSALAMFLIPFSALLILSADSTPKSNNAMILNAFAGSCVSLIILTRVQIGFAIFLGCLTLFLLYKRIRQLAFFSLGFCISISLFLLYLIRRGIFLDTLNDVIGFGSTYVLGDKSTFPKPIWTTVLTISFILIYFIFRFIPSFNLSKLMASGVAVILATLFVGAILVLSSRNLSFVQLLTVATRRIWIAILLATALTAAVALLVSLVRRTVLLDFKLALLIGFGFVAELQVFPLFDQMHAWWASTPIIILTLICVISHSKVKTLSRFGKNSIEIAALLSVVLVSLITFYSTLSHVRVPLQINGFSGILINATEGKEIAGTNRFLISHISKNDKVLNLCTNANVFFDSVNRPHSASRVFIFWSPMFEVDSLKNSILFSEPSKIVTCSSVTNPSFYQQYMKLQNQILSTFEGRISKPIQYISENEVTWKVYSRVD